MADVTKTDSKDLQEIIYFRADDAEEKLVISYYLRDHSFIALYCQAGFQLAAIEPLQLVAKRELDKAWQFTALENLQHQYLAAATLNLKLLDRENFYEIINA